MSLEHSPIKKIFSAGLACLVLFNTSCGFRSASSARDTDTRVSGWLENVLGESTGGNRSVDRDPRPDSYRFQREPAQNKETHDFYFSSPGNRRGPDSSIPSSLPEVHADLQRGGELIDEQRQYLAGHAERMAEVRAACRQVGCDGVEGIDEGNLKEARDLIRVDKSDIPSDRRTALKTREDVRQELERIEKELQQEKSNWEKIRVSTQERKAQTTAQHKNLADKVGQAIDEAVQSVTDQVRISEGIRKELIDAHNAGIDKTYSTLGVDPATGFDSEPADADKELIPSVHEVRRLQKSNTLLRTTAAIPSLNESADVLLQLARNSALRGDMAAYDRRIEAARAFAWASQHKGPVNARALEAAQNLGHSAQSLESQGLFSLADLAIAKAQELLRVGLDLARFNAAVDVSLSLMEAFSGKTIDFNEDGQPHLRDCSAWERGFAVGTLALGAAALASGSAPVFAAVIAAGGAQKVLNAFKEHASITRGAEAGLRLFEETVTVAKDIDRAAPTLMAHTALSPYAKRHIWEGEIRISHDWTKVRIDGGLHTQDGLKNYLAQAPIENAPVSREMLSNGVERVVFPDSALTKSEKSKLEIAARHGVGRPNSKTLFPASWTPETLEKVIDLAKTEGRTISVGEMGFKKEISYDGVTVTVNFGKDGRVNSAFPSWNQGGDRG